MANSTESSLWSSEGYINNHLTISLFVLLLLFPVYILRFRIFGHGKFLDDQPWVGWEDEPFSYLKGILRCAREAKDVVNKGYNKFSKSEKTFVFASVQSGPILILPSSQLKDVLHQPDSVVDGNEAVDAAVQLRHTMSDPDMYLDKFHINVIRKQLTRNLTDLTPVVAEEIDIGLRAFWGEDTGWRDVELLQVMPKLITQITCRMFYGPELCRNEEFLGYVRGYSSYLAKGGMALGLAPPILRPLIGSLIGYLGKRQMEKARKFSLPFMEQRIKDMQKKAKDPNSTWEPPADGVQWLLDEASKTSVPSLSQAPSLAHRLLFLNMLAVDSTAMAVSSLLLDVFSAGSEVASGLKEEYERELLRSGGHWTKSAIDGCIRADSALRESMRFSNFGLVNFPRRVVAESGIDLANGTHVPRNTKVAAPMESIHRDDRFYPNPNEYDAFRFSRDLEGKQTGGENDRLSTSTTVSDTFLSFGYGRHACPGRFFATVEMKLILAQALLEYEIEPIKEHPEMVHFLEFKIVPEGTKIRVRKRI